MQVRCPECLQAIELSSDSTLRKIDCPDCGSNFNLVGDETVIGEGKTSSVTDGSVHAIGHFTLKKEVGRGAFGTVWLARDQKLDRDVAIKVPRRGQLNGDEAERFFREARASAQLQHPSIVTVHEVGRDGETIFVVSDFIHGVTLSDWLEAQQLTARETAELCVKIADALHHAHEMGIVHRDLKPGNIMMDRDGEPRVMDFGLAKRDTNEVTLTLDGQILGTPAYMSPEQAQGQGAAADRRADIYSLGVVLFQLLTGEVPFRGNVRMLVQQIINDEPPSPRKLNAKIPKDLETICLRCIQKSPQRRYQTMADVVDDLQRWLNKEPITARPIGRLERSWLWCRRKPVIASLTALVYLVTVTGIVAVTWQWRQAVAARKSAVEKTAQVVAAQSEVERQRDSARESALAAIAAKNSAIHQQQLTRLQLYVSDMYRLPQLWDSNAHGMVNQVLERHIPETDEQDVRGFEWHFWRRHSRRYAWDKKLPYLNPALTPFTLQANRCPCRIALMDDGKQLILENGYEARHTFRIHDVNEGGLVEEVSYPRRGNSAVTSNHARISSVSYGNSATTMAIINERGDLHVLDGVSGDLVESFRANQSPFTASDFSDDGYILAMCAGDGTVQVHDLKSGETICSIQIAPRAYGNGLMSYPWRVSFSRSARMLAVSLFGKSQPIMIFDIDSATKKQELPVEDNSSGEFTTRDDRLVTCGKSGQIHLWDLSTGTAIASRPAHTIAVRQIEVSRDRKYVATAAADRIVNVWDTATLERVQSIRGHETGVKSIEFSKNNTHIYSRSLTELCKWELQRAESAFEVIRNDQRVDGLHANMDGQKIAICSGHTAMILDTSSGQNSVILKHDSALSTGVLSNDGELFVASDPNRLLMWTASDKTLELLATIPRRAHTVALSPDRKWVVAGAGNPHNDEHDAFLKIVSLSSREDWDIPTGDGAITGVVFLGKESFLTASSGIDGRLSKWNLASRTIETSVKAAGLNVVDISIPRGIAAISGYGARVQIVDTNTLQIIATLPATGAYVHDLEFLSDGRTLAVADNSGEIKLWNIASHQLVGELKGHQSVVHKLSSAMNPPRLYSASLDGEVRVWYGDEESRSR